MGFEQLLIVATGGTIDKSYGTGLGVTDLSFSGPPAVSEILREVKATGDQAIMPLMAKDSVFMTDEDRATIAALCAAVPHKRILITHGTDTMIATATVVADKVKDKTVVLTGASQPAVMKGSDASFNVGFAMQAALSAPAGVYVAMNGRLHMHDKVKKADTGIFEPI